MESKHITLVDRLSRSDEDSLKQYRWISSVPLVFSQVPRLFVGYDIYRQIKGFAGPMAACGVRIPVWT